jgi:hypothetical protein
LVPSDSSPSGISSAGVALEVEPKDCPCLVWGFFAKLIQSIPKKPPRHRLPVAAPASRSGIATVCRAVNRRHPEVLQKARKSLDYVGRFQLGLQNSSSKISNLSRSFVSYRWTIPQFTIDFSSLRRAGRLPADAGAATLQI